MLGACIYIRSMLEHFPKKSEAFLKVHLVLNNTVPN